MFGITCFVEVSGHIVISLTYDPSTTLYGYSSYSGMIVVVWRFVQLIWFMKNITTTYFSERDHYRKRLYMWFGFIFSIWFLSLPGVVLTVSHLVAPHWRYKIVRGTIDVIHLLALTSYGVLFWPAWSSHIFEIRGSPRSIEEQNRFWLFCCCFFGPGPVLQKRAKKKNKQTEKPKPRPQHKTDRCRGGR